MKKLLLLVIVILTGCKGSPDLDFECFNNANLRACQESAEKESAPDLKARYLEKACSLGDQKSCK